MTIRFRSKSFYLSDRCKVIRSYKNSCLCYILIVTSNDAVISTSLLLSGVKSEIFFESYPSAEDGGSSNGVCL